MSKQAQLADGTILEFPDDTPDAVMDKAVRAHLASQSPKPGGGDLRNLILGKKPAENEWLRAGKLAARNVIEGGANLAGIITDPLVATSNALLGRQDYDARSSVGMTLDKLGFPRPETDAERLTSAVNEGLAGGGGWIGLGRKAMTAATPVVRSVGQTLSAGPGQQLAGAGLGAGAAETTRQSGGGTGAQVAAGLAGGLGPTALVSVGSMGIRGLLRGGEAGRQAMEQSLNDFRSVGATPSVGQATGNRRTQGLESLLSASPTSSGVLARAAETQADDIGTGLRASADALSPNASAERAGRAVEKGVETFAAGVKATRDRLYAAADQAIPPNTPIPIANTEQTLLRLTTPTPGAANTTSALMNPKIATLAQTLAADTQANGGRLPYEALRAVRSRIGTELSDFTLSADRPTAEYRAIYAALSRDMEAAAQAQGPAAVQAMKRANNFFRVSAERLTQLERVVDKAGGPEKVYTAVMSGTQDGGTTLRAVMQSLPKDGQRAMTAAVIKRMGLATKGNQDAAGEVFSAQTFLTNWNGVSKEAKRALFDRHGPRFVADMDKLARVAERIRTGSKVFANPSGTTNRAAALTYGGSLVGAGATGQVGALGMLLAGGTIANLGARLMTKPRFVEWLARTTEMPKGAALQQALILKGIATRSDDPEMAEFAEALRQQEVNQAGNAR